MAEPLPMTARSHPVTFFKTMVLTEPGYSSSMTFAEMCEYVRTPKVYDIPTDHTIAKMNKPSDLGMIGLFDSPSGGANTEDVTSVCWQALDYDAGTTSIEDAMRLWSQVAPCVLHTSWNHKPATPRFRVIIELSRPVNYDEHRALFRAILSKVEQSKHTIDRACRNIARRWFVPSHRADQEYVVRESSIMPPLNVDDTIAALHANDQKNIQRVVSYTDHAFSSTNDKSRRGLGYLEKVAAPKVREAPLGTRNDVLLKYSILCGGLIANGWLSRSVTESVLLGAILANGGDEPKDRMVIGRGIKYGESRPIDLPDQNKVRHLAPPQRFPSESNPDILAQVLRKTPPVQRPEQDHAAEQANDSERSWFDVLTKDDFGKIEATGSNLTILMEHKSEFIDLLSYNVRTGAVMISRPPPRNECIPQVSATYPRALRDDDCAAIRMYFEGGDLRLRFKVEDVHTSVAFVARARSSDPVVDYLSRLTWDGTPRLASWMHESCGIVNTAYVSTVGRKWIISGVARALRPGCKVDTMLVLEGGQGKRKSTLLAALMPDESLFCDHLPALDQHIQVVEQIRGPWLIEVAELDAFGKADETRIKQFLSATKDRYTAKYKRNAEDVQRAVFFAGTTNRTEWIKDTTGGRRFWPVQVDDTATINLGWVTANRDQLWAEAVAMFKGGESWWLNDSEEADAKGEQASRIEVDPWHGAIEERLVGRAETTMAELLRDVCGIDMSRQTVKESKRIVAILNALGWERRQKRGVLGREYVYQRRTPF